MNETLRRELLEMSERDQAMRREATKYHPPGQPVDPADREHWFSVDRANTSRMKEIVAAHGWPGFALAGDDGAGAAWLLVQHADLHRDFQHQCFVLIERAVASGDAEPRHLAYLTDRLRVAEGRPQVYGTQMRVVDGKIVPGNIEDPGHVDERRAAMGLGTLADDIAGFAE
jgi:hypothetical protein